MILPACCPDAVKYTRDETLEYHITPENKPIGWFILTWVRSTSSRMTQILLVPLRFCPWCGVPLPLDEEKPEE